MSSNEQFPASHTDHPSRPEGADPVRSEGADPVRSEHVEVTGTGSAQVEVATDNTEAALVRLPSMVDLDSLAESLDQVDLTLAELDQTQASS